MPSGPRTEAPSTASLSSWCSKLCNTPRPSQSVYMTDLVRVRLRVDARVRVRVRVKA